MIAYNAYRIFTTLLFPAFVPLFWLYSRQTGRFRQSFSQMLGVRSSCMPPIPPGRPRVWIHAVSVGEVGVAFAIIEALRKILPGAAFILSVTTEHGHAYAVNRIKTNNWKHKITYVFAPLDFPGCVRRTLAALQPDILACLETEIWPNKYDLLLGQADKSIVNQMRRLYNLHKNRPVFITGSVRRPEEKAILDAYREIVRIVPETVLIIAPRHRERTAHIARMVIEKGFECQLRTEFDSPDQVRHAPVVVIDTIGELLATYSIASAVFCGGSLAPLGGQNILEPAVWGKPVLYGPSMEDFSDAKALLEQTGGSIEVKNSRELAQKVIFLLTHPDEAAVIGQKALEAVLLNKGASAKHAAAIKSLLKK